MVRWIGCMDFREFVIPYIFLNYVSKCTIVGGLKHKWGLKYNAHSCNNEFSLSSMPCHFLFISGIKSG